MILILALPIIRLALKPPPVITKLPLPPTVIAPLAIILPPGSTVNVFEDTFELKIANEFAAFANLALAEGCFADGENYDAWATINTTAQANWSNISTSTAMPEYPFNTFATLAIGEGTFADGDVPETWATINTV